MRYEISLEPHAHFRCRLCLRVFNLTSGQQDPSQIKDAGFSVERVETRAEGICDECIDYDVGLHAGARAIIATGPATHALAASGTAVSELDSPLGQLWLAASPTGLTRVAFEDHGDVEALREHATRRRGSQLAHRHLAEASASLRGYFAGELELPVCTIDWDQLDLDATALKTTRVIPYGTRRSYSAFGQGLSPQNLGRLFGCNPIPLFAPCHRVGRGTETPTAFVGGIERRRWLETHEHTHPFS